VHCSYALRKRAVTPLPLQQVACDSALQAPKQRPHSGKGESLQSG
jgi:hypothetical protein